MREHARSRNGRSVSRCAQNLVRTFSMNVAMNTKLESNYLLF